MKNEVSVSLSSRIDSNGKSILTANLQRFNQLTLSYYRKIKNVLEIGTELKKSKENLSFLGGLRIKNEKSEVKCSLSSEKEFNFYWSEKLSENIKIEFSTNCLIESNCFEDLEYGVTLIHED